MKIAIGIVTAGRRDILSETIRVMATQIRPADEILICPANVSDLDIACLEGFPSPVRVLTGRVGASAQRNVLLDATSADVIVFFDDDFLPANDFLFEVEQLFASNPTVVIATGTVLADGAAGPGFNHQEGEHLLSSLKSSSIPSLVSRLSMVTVAIWLSTLPFRDQNLFGSMSVCPSTVGWKMSIFLDNAHHWEKS